MRLLLFSFFLFSLNAFANMDKAPAAIEVSRGDFAIYVDFEIADYQITYDVAKKSATVKSIIKFHSAERGYPIFDMVENATTAELDGKAVKVLTYRTEVTNVRRLDTLVEPGEHTLIISSPLNDLVDYASWFSKNVKSAFWTSDLSDRSYLERYMPTNLEFDQFTMNFDVRVLNSSEEHELMANGKVQKLAKNHYRVQFPEYYTSSSVFYHIFPKGSFKMVKGEFTSMDGRIIPIIAYSGMFTPTKIFENTKKILAELEKDYGRWPHPSVIVYNAGSGGMEYAGATMTSSSALGHELIHSYFARGMMPARGNSGWIDEAMASWRDAGYHSKTRSNLTKTNMASHSEYRRTTDRRAYSDGRDFLGYLDTRFKDQGGLKPFMKHYHQTRLFKPMLTADFISDMNAFFNADVSEDFDTFIFGKTGVAEGIFIEENPYHQQMTDEELFNLL